MKIHLRYVGIFRIVHAEKIILRFYHIDFFNEKFITHVAAQASVTVITGKRLKLAKYV